MTSAIKWWTVGLCSAPTSVWTCVSARACVLQAISALAKLAHCKPGLDALFRTHLKDVKDVMATSDIIRYRVYEVCLHLLLYDVWSSQQIRFWLVLLSRFPLCVCAVGGGGVRSLCRIAGLLRQHRLHLPAIRRDGWRRHPGSVTTHGNTHAHTVLTSTIHYPCAKKKCRRTHMELLCPCGYTCGQNFYP